MKTICLYFEIHQNIQLKRYRFSISALITIIMMIMRTLVSSVM